MDISEFPMQLENKRGTSGHLNLARSGRVVVNTSRARLREVGIELHSAEKNEDGQDKIKTEEQLIDETYAVVSTYLDQFLELKQLIEQGRQIRSSESAGLDSKVSQLVAEAGKKVEDERIKEALHKLTEADATLNYLKYILDDPKKYASLDYKNAVPALKERIKINYGGDIPNLRETLPKATE